jgi:hypothetical protein
MLEGNMDWPTKTPFLKKERGFLLKIIGSRRFCADPYAHMQRNAVKKFMVIFTLLLCFLTFDAEAQTKDTPHYDVVSEYIRSLGSIYTIQQTATNENKISKGDLTKVLLDSIRNGTRFKLALNASIGALERMSLKEPFETLLPNTIQWYKYKIDLFGEMVEISKTLIDGPKPGVDYGKMTARMPEITAQIEYIDESIFQSMVLVFALLIDEKPDKDGHMSRLNITKAERKKLIDNLNGSFGKSLNNKNKTWTVSSAALLKAYLLKDYKCADE